MRNQCAMVQALFVAGLACLGAAIALDPYSWELWLGAPIAVAGCIVLGLEPHREAE